MYSNLSANLWGINSPSIVSNTIISTDLSVFIGFDGIKHLISLWLNSYIGQSIPSILTVLVILKPVPLMKSIAPPPTPLEVGLNRSTVNSKFIESDDCISAYPNPSTFTEKLYFPKGISGAKHLSSVVVASKTTQVKFPILIVFLFISVEKLVPVKVIVGRDDVSIIVTVGVKIPIYSKSHEPEHFDVIPLKYFLWVF